LTYLVNPNH
jgi:20S proteasome subunit alpha 5